MRGRAVAALAGVIALSGCGSSAMTEDEALDHLADDGVSAFTDDVDEGLLEYMKMNCYGLDHGQSIYSIIYGRLNSRAMPEDEARDRALVLATAVATYCPEHQNALAEAPQAPHD